MQEVNKLTNHSFPVLRFQQDLLHKSYSKDYKGKGHKVIIISGKKFILESVLSFREVKRNLKAFLMQNLISSSLVFLKALNYDNETHVQNKFI